MMKSVQSFLSDVYKRQSTRRGYLPVHRWHSKSTPVSPSPFQPSCLSASSLGTAYWPRIPSSPKLTAMAWSISCIVLAFNRPMYSFNLARSMVRTCSCLLYTSWGKCPSSFPDKLFQQFSHRFRGKSLQVKVAFFSDPHFCFLFFCSLFITLQLIDMYLIFQFSHLASLV